MIKIEALEENYTIKLPYQDFETCMYFEVHDETGQIELNGAVKWDGCVNVTNKGYLHFCNPKELKRFEIIMLEVYKLAKTKIEEIDPDEFIV